MGKYVRWRAPLRSPRISRQPSNLATSNSAVRFLSPRLFLRPRKPRPKKRGLLAKLVWIRSEFRLRGERRSSASFSIYVTLIIMKQVLIGFIGDHQGYSRSFSKFVHRPFKFSIFRTKLESLSRNYVTKKQICVWNRLLNHSCGRIFRSGFSASARGLLKDQRPEYTAANTKLYSDRCLNFVPFTRQESRSAFTSIGRPP